MKAWSYSDNIEEEFAAKLVVYAQTTGEKSPLDDLFNQRDGKSKRT